MTIFSVAASLKSLGSVTSGRACSVSEEHRQQGLNTEHCPNSVYPEGGWAGGGVCLYRGRPPPLAADATEVERPHLHLHSGNGELVAFPVVPVDTL